MKRGQNKPRLPPPNNVSYGFDPRATYPPPPNNRFGRVPDHFYDLGGATGYDFGHQRGDLSWDHGYTPPDYRRSRNFQRQSRPPYKSSKNWEFTPSEHLSKTMGTPPPTSKPSTTSNQPSTPSTQSNLGNTVPSNGQPTELSNSISEHNSNNLGTRPKENNGTKGNPPPVVPMDKLDELLHKQAQLQEEITKHLSDFELTNNDDVLTYMANFDIDGNHNTNNSYHPNSTNFQSHTERHNSDSASETGRGSTSSNSSRRDPNATKTEEEQLPPFVVTQIKNLVEDQVNALVSNLSQPNRPTHNNINNRGRDNAPLRPEQTDTTPRRPNIRRNNDQRNVDFQDTFTTYGLDQTTRPHRQDIPYCSTPAVQPSNLPELDADLLGHVIVDALKDHFQQNTPTGGNTQQQRTTSHRQFDPTTPYGNSGHPSQNPPDPNSFRTFHNGDVTRPQMITTFSDTGLEKFSGRTKDYQNFKDLFKIVTEGYPEKYKLLKLRQFLDYKSNAEIAYIHADDEGALDKAWKELDDLHGQGQGNGEYHVSQVMSVMTWKPCETQNDLEKLYTHLKTHLAMAQRAGDHYHHQTEGLAHFMSNILYGWCQDKVIELKLDRPDEFCMDKIMGFLKRAVQHDRLKSRETKNSSNLRQTRYQPNNRREGSYFGGNNYKDERQKSFSKNYRDSSPGSNFSRNPSRERQSRPQHRDSRPRQGERSGSNYRAGYNNGSQEVANFNVDTTESPARNHQRSNSPHPRGARAKSPSRSPNGRQSYRCVFCMDNEHLSMNCTKVTSDNALSKARSEKLCFICLTGGHRPFFCPVGLLCGNPTCQDRQEPRHGKLLCTAFQKQ